MIVIYSKNRIPVRITRERWKHIIRRHVEMTNQRDKVLETVADPDPILECDFGELLAVRFYSKTPLTTKHLVVAHREVSGDDGFVLTAYFANALSKKRVTVWRG